MPAGFFFPDVNARLWRPAPLTSDPRLGEERGSHWLAAVARLAPGVTLSQAEAELTPLMQAWRSEDEHHIGHFIVLRPFIEEIVGAQRGVLVLLLGAVGLVLLIICANLGNLLLTRAEGRRREMAVRVALGAGQGRLTRQLLTENVVLTATGGAAGVGVAYVFMQLLQHLGDGALPSGHAPALDMRVLAFTAAISVLTGLLFGVLPSMQTRSLRIQETLRSEGRGATAHGRTARVRRALVVVEIALSVAVVSAAALLVRSYDNLRRIDVGFGDSPAMALDMTLPTAAYAQTARIAAFYAALRTEVSALPGVTAAGFVSDLPLRAMPGMDGFRIEGRPEPQRGEPSYNGGYVMATPGYFAAVGIPLLRGRGIEERDVRGAPLIAVIDELAAKEFWPGVDPIGQRIRYYGADSLWLTIVGVVGSVHYESPQLAARPAIYVAHAQAPRGGFYHGRTMTLVVRGAQDPGSLAVTVRALVRKLDAQVPVTNVATVENVVADAIGRPRFAGTLMSLFALASLLVGALGVYGVLSYLVRARTQEIGVRMALGASTASVQRMVLRQGMLLTGIGLAAGAAASVAAASVVREMLYGISPTDPLTLLMVGAVLAGVSFLASYLPARRATRIDPASALRGS
jgi:putative ABC transport system permease protein